MNDKPKILQNIEEDLIDRSQWVPDKEPVINPQRILQGDMDYAYSASGRLLYAKMQTGSLMSFLADAQQMAAWCQRNARPVLKPVLEYEHLYDGTTYEILQTAYLSRLGFRNSSIYYSEVRSALTGSGLKEEDFSLLLKSLAAHHKKLIEAAIYGHATEFARGMVMRTPDLYRKAFDRLVELMEELRKKREDEKNACAQP